MYDLIILGAGPAGLSAAVYAIRKRLDFLVISQDLGGRTNTLVTLPEVEDYTIIKAREQVGVYRSRLHYRSELLRTEKITKLQALGEPGAVKATVFQVNTRRSDGMEQRYETRTVLIATGTKTVSLDVPGLKQFWGRGLGTNIQSYNHAFWEKDVFLYGDSTRVLWAALDLSDFAAGVHLAIPTDGSYDLDVLDQLREHENIFLYEDAKLLEFQGNEFCRTVEIQTPQGIVSIHAAGFFLEFDPEPALDFIDPQLGLARDDDDRIVVDRFMESSVSGLFAAGDVCTMGRYQVLTALGQGAGAALSIYQWLRRPTIID